MTDYRPSDTVVDFARVEQALSVLPRQPSIYDPRLEGHYRAFRKHLAPLIALGERFPNASEVTVDGPWIALDLGDSWQQYEFSDFPGLRPLDIEAAASAAAVASDIQFGMQRPARQHMSVKIPPDLRVSVVCPGISPQWHLSLRFLRSRSLDFSDYLSAGIMEPGQVAAIEQLLAPPKNQQKKTIIVSGQTSSGKTTLLRTLIEFCVQRGERILIIEDTPELNVPGRSVLQWSTTLDTDMSELVKQSLRHRPDRIVVGEVRGPEALELVRACNTGHSGLLATIHSNGADDTLGRLHTLSLEAQPSFPLSGIKSAIDVDLHLEGRGSKRKLAPIHHFKTG